MRSASEHGVARVFMISNWCLTASDSAATVPGPRGLASFAKVTSRWAIKMNSSRMKANFNGLRRIHRLPARSAFCQN